MLRMFPPMPTKFQVCTTKTLCFTADQKYAPNVHPDITGRLGFGVVTAFLEFEPAPPPL